MDMKHKDAQGLYSSLNGGQMERLLYGKKYPALLQGNCCGPDVRFGTRPENRFPQEPEAPPTSASVQIMVYPNLINLEGDPGSPHQMDSFTVPGGLGLEISFGGGSSSDQDVHIGNPSIGAWANPQPGTFTVDGSTGQLDLSFLQFVFPAAWPLGTDFTSHVWFTVASNGAQALLTIHGYVPGGTPAGANDYIILDGPTIFSAITGIGISNPNCPPGFCPVHYTAQFIDFEGDGTTMPQWNWMLELLQPQGFVEVESFVGTTFPHSPYSGFYIHSQLQLSVFSNWQRNANGNVIGRVTVSGNDSDGYSQSATMNVEVTDVPQGRPLTVAPGHRIPPPSSSS